MAPLTFDGLMKTADDNDMELVHDCYLSGRDCCAAGLAAIHLLGYQEAVRVIDEWSESTYPKSIAKAADIDHRIIEALEYGYEDQPDEFQVMECRETCRKYYELGQQLRSESYDDADD